jgi:hypothetical protein
LSGTSAMAVAFVTTSSLTRASGVVISANEQELQTLSLFLIVEKVPVVAQQGQRENKVNGHGAHFYYSWLFAVTTLRERLQYIGSVLYSYYCTYQVLCVCKDQLNENRGCLGLG